jgi:hypothetical protein
VPGAGAQQLDGLVLARPLLEEERVSYDRSSGDGVWRVWAAGAAGVLVLILVAFGLWASIKAFKRYQARADASNRVKVTAIQIKNYEQRKKVEQQKADIRYVQATGIRRAQDEIAKTLTPLYVQFEMVDALRRIAESGRNSSVVFIPAGSGGIPLVGNVPTGGAAKGDE